MDRGVRDEMNTLGQCSVRECERPAVTSIELCTVCLSHFITTCDSKLGELSKDLQMGPLEQITSETACRFTNECFEKGTDLSRNQPEPAITERARLLGIIFWAIQLERQLR